MESLCIESLFQQDCIDENENELHRIGRVANVAVCDPRWVQMCSVDEIGTMSVRPTASAQLYIMTEINRAASVRNHRVS